MAICTAERAFRCPFPAATTTFSRTRLCTTMWGTCGTSGSSRCHEGGSAHRVVLRFDAATHRATVWVDDTQVVEHEGGYTPFEVDISDLVREDREMRVTVAVNNELTWQSLPPGIVEVMPDGERRQRQYHDFFNYAGLHRSVWLYSTPTTYIADLTVVTELDSQTGLVRSEVSVDESRRAGCADGAARCRRFARRRNRGAGCRADGVRTHSSGSPAVAISTGSRWTWSETTRFSSIATRSLSASAPWRVDGTKFLINGQPFYFKGFGKHEDLNVHGRGHNDAAMVNDFALLGWIGANSFRTSHYPYAEEVLDLADRLGVVVIDETAAVGLNLGVGGGFFLGGPRETFSEETIGSATQAVHQRAIEELIARDKNHPSWCSGVWPTSRSPIPSQPAPTSPRSSRRRERPIQRRPVGFVNMMFAQPNDCTVTELADVIMINRYYGWYMEPGDLVAAERGWEHELLGWAELGKPILVTEYGADAMPGLHSLDDAVWSEEYQVAMLDVAHRVFDRIDAVVGEQVWNFADFATGPSFMRVDGNKKGVFTRDRRPKAAARYLRQRWLNVP